MFDIINSVTWSILDADKNFHCMCAHPSRIAMQNAIWHVEIPMNPINNAQYIIRAHSSRTRTYDRQINCSIIHQTNQ